MAVNKRKKKNKKNIQIAVVVGVLVIALLVPTLIGLRNGTISNVDIGATATERIKNLSKVVVATVNSVKITQLEFERDVDYEYTELLRKGNARLDQKDSVRASVMATLIREALILDAANKAGYNISQSEVNGLVAIDKAEYYDDDEWASFLNNWDFTDELNDDEWASFLNNWDFTDELYAEHVRKQEIIANFPLQAIGEIVVSEEEIQAEYEDRLSRDPSLVLDNVRSNIVLMLTYSKQADTYQNWYNNLLDNATITYNEPRTQAYMALVEGDYEEAEAQYKKAMADNPTDPYIPLNLGLVMTKAGKIDEGLQMIENSLELEPADPYIMLVYGQVLYEQGYVEETRQALLRASDIATDDISAHGEIRNAFRNYGMTEEYEREQVILAEILEQQKITTTQQLTDMLY